MVSRVYPMTKRSRKATRRPQPRKPAAHGRIAEHTIEICLGLAGVILAAVTTIDQLQDHRSATESGLIVGAVLFAVALFLLSGLRKQSSPRNRGFLIGSGWI